jgi:presequence protease
MAVSASFLSSCDPAEDYPGYRLVEKRFVKEVNADCYLMEHIKSGARVLKIVADDPNKTFSIAFRTVPESDAGTPHIMEHAVLNGSENFPVKSPFDVLSKGSLNTFLNAMTSDDYTVYPVASMNLTDYFNLMHVYLDAVFNPLIYTDRRIFMQEGWHYELKEKTDPVEYKGVVYNEMKGAFSNPEREMWYRIQQTLFPENGYRYSSGGYPAAIPTLTYEDFIRFHRKHYHPSNSYIFLYGDADLQEELAFIDKEYLSKYDKAEPPVFPAMNAPFRKVKEVTASYSVIEGAPTDQQTYLTMNWVIGSGSDPATVMALDILADVLVNQESAPLRKALQESGIGKDVSATSQNMHQNLFSIVVKNASPGDKDNFRKVIMKTLVQVRKNKIDRETLEGSLNRLEFRLREGNDAQKGITYNMRSINNWLYANDPFPALEYEQQISGVKQALENTNLEDIIQKDLIENPYGLILVLEPKPGLEKETSDRITAELSEYKKKLVPAEIDSIIRTTADLIAFQQKEDSPEAMATIPLLKLSDIDKETAWYEAGVHDLSGIQQLYFNEFTNQVIYMNYLFDLRALAEDKLPYAVILAELLGKLEAGSYGYEQLDKKINISTGGYSNSLNYFLPGQDDNLLMPKFRINLKTTAGKLDTAMHLLGIILSDTRFENRDRVHELLKRHQSQVETSVTQNGLGVAVNRLESYYSRRGVFADKIRGMDYYRFITGLTRSYESDPDKVIAELKQVYDLLFSRDNLIAATTCSESDYKLYAGSLGAFVNALPDRPVTLHSWALTPVPKNEGILTASKVQYVLQGFDYRRLGMIWNGKWNVLSQIMSTDWLQTQIRVIGGAYGGWSALGRNGTAYFASYRDPNLKETLDNFKATVDYLSRFTADSTAMTRYIIGTISNLDYPLTPSQKGDMAFRWFLDNTTREQLQHERDEVLATTDEDIRNMSPVVSRILDQKSFCVYGNDEKLRSCRDLFENLIILQQ